MKRFSHSVDAHAYAGQCECGGSLHAEPDYEKPTRFSRHETGGVEKTKYLDAVVHSHGVVVRCARCHRFQTQPLSDWGIETETSTEVLPCEKRATHADANSATKKTLSATGAASPQKNSETNPALSTLCQMLGKCLTIVGILAIGIITAPLFAIFPTEPGQDH